MLREGEGVAARVLKSLEVDIERTRNEILKELDPNFTPPESDPELGATGEPSKKDVKTPALRAFGRDLTELAKKGELDPVIGRHNEIERVIQVLCRRTKNNPVLLGEAGRRQDRDRRGPRPGDRERQRAGTFAGQKGHHA